MRVVDAELAQAALYLDRGAPCAPDVGAAEGAGYDIGYTVIVLV